MTNTPLLLKACTVLLCLYLYTACSDKKVEEVISTVTNDFRSYPVDINTPMVDLGEDWFWKGTQGHMTEQLVKLESSYKAWDLQMYLSDDFIFARTPIGYKTSKDFLIDRATGKSTSLDVHNAAKELYALSLEMVDNDRFLFSLPSDEVDALLSEFDQSQIDYREGTTLETIESSENPVLIWIQFKTGK